MEKIIQPVLCDVGSAVPAKGYCKIEYENGCLSIHGVIGPTSRGNARGSCGQCVEEIRQGTPVDGWTAEMLNRFCDIWEKWHLNDMRPYCSHQKELGWDKLAAKSVPLFHYTLTMEALKKQSEAKDAAIRALKNGETFTPTAEQIRYANMKHSITLPTLIGAELTEDYQEKKPLYKGDEGAVTYKPLGWLYPKDHPDGILTKECPVCGYKYGTKWLHEDVPQDVLDWLFALPKASARPAWI